MRELIDRALAEYLQEDDRRYKTAVYEAMEYSLLAGGKRIRPILTLLFCALCGGTRSQAMPFACALEMVHCYSLIHDDLPCMDNDDLRRGRPTNHRVFGQDIALLAGDGLLTKAFEICACAEIPAEKALKAVSILARCAGPTGMIGGQCIDLKAQGRTVELPELEAMNMGKTVALIDAGCRMGAVIGGGDDAAQEAARQYAVCLGMAFQIRDDILDVVGDTQLLGKATGADQIQKKCNYVTLLGLEKAEALVKTHTDRAMQALDFFAGDTADLRDFARSLQHRNQ